MRNRTTLVVVISVLILIAVGALVYMQLFGSQAGSPQSSKDPQQAATQALATFPKLITADNYQAMGFQSVDEVSRATLGDPLPVFRVRLDQLQQYQPGSDPEKLLIDGNRVIYPVTVDQQVRSSIVVEGSNNDWKATNMGGPNLIKSLAQVRKERTDFVVQVPALSLYFVARRVENQLTLTPIIKDPRFESFVPGRALSADQVFTAVLPAAKAHNGLPD